MRKRIAIWTALGLFIACCWTVWAFATAPDVEVTRRGMDRVILALALITCPAIALGVMFYWVIPLNGVTYAVLGSVVESFRRKSNPN